LDRVELDIRRGHWVKDEGLGNRTLRECCEAYLEENPRIGKRWAETCRRNMRLHLTDLLDLPISAITAPVVRTWHAKVLRGNGGRTSISQSYRLVRAVFNVAVQDESDLAQSVSDSGRRHCEGAREADCVPSAGGRPA